MKHVYIIGAGASGLAAAISASSNGHKVTVFEKNSKVGRKIYITGKGRCNITNNCSTEDFFKNIVTNAKFLYSSINNFTPADCINLFESNGCSLKTERGNRVFPVTDKSTDIIDCMLSICRKNGVSLRLNETVTSINIDENNQISTVKTNKGTYNCDHLIIATGGKSYPLTGSTGDGYTFAKQLGHTVTKLYPSLIAFDTVEDYTPVFGLTLKNVILNITEKSGKKIITEQGDITFTDRGIGGPLFVTASAYVNKLQLSNLIFSLDLKPALSYEKLKNRILREFQELQNKTLKECLYRLLPKLFIPFFLKNAQIKGNKPIKEINDDLMDRLIKTFKCYNVAITNLRPIEEAIVTSGGISVKEINPKTMQSKLIKGLSFAGEIIDVDALTGGFNLQIAISTGMAAGGNI